MTRHNHLSRRGFLQSAGVAAALASPGLAQAQGKAAGPARKRSHKYEDLLPEEFYEELARAPIAYWGCGAMEEHGLQCALGTDLYAAYETGSIRPAPGESRKTSSLRSSRISPRSGWNTLRRPTPSWATGR